MLAALTLLTFWKQGRCVFTGSTDMDRTPKMGEDKRKGTSVSPTLSPVASSLTNFPPTQYFEVTQTAFVQIQFCH